MDSELSNFIEFADGQGTVNAGCPVTLQIVTEGSGIPEAADFAGRPFYCDTASGCVFMLCGAFVQRISQFNDTGSVWMGAGEIRATDEAPNSRIDILSPQTIVLPNPTCDDISGALLFTAHADFIVAPATEMYLYFQYSFDGGATYTSPHQRLGVRRGDGNIENEIHWDDQIGTMHLTRQVPSGGLPVTLRVQGEWGYWAGQTPTASEIGHTQALSIQFGLQYLVTG